MQKFDWKVQLWKIIFKFSTDYKIFRETEALEQKHAQFTERADPVVDWYKHNITWDKVFADCFISVYWGASNLETTTMNENQYWIASDRL